MPADHDAPGEGGRMLPIQLAPELQQALAVFRELSMRIAESVRPVVIATARASAVLEPLRGVLHAIASKLRPGLDAGWMEVFQQRMEAIATGVRVLETAMANAESIGRMGWTIPMNANLHDCVDLLLEAPNGREAIDEAFARFYTDNEKESLLLLLADLRQHPRLEEFVPVLEEVSFGLLHEKYRLAVTALIPIFEGVARRCWVDGFWRGTERRSFFAKRIEEAPERSYDRIVWSATRAFVDVLYENNFDGEPKPHSLNRHWILHGRGPADASLVDALRLLQAIHTVVSLEDEDIADPEGDEQVPG